MRPVTLRSVAELTAVAPDDGMLFWVAQNLQPGVLAWRLGDAVVVACRDLSRRDRLAVHGPLTEVRDLVRHALAVVGPTFRPIGDATLLRTLTARSPELALVAEFEWMELSRPPATAASPLDVRWLTNRDLPAVATLLDTAFPDSNAHPRHPGFRRWAGASTEPGATPISVAADAWSTPGMGFIAGVTTAPAARGRGAARAVCAFVAEALVREEGRVGLMVDSDNVAARAVYARLGFASQRVAAARLRD